MLPAFNQFEVLPPVDLGGMPRLRLFETDVNIAKFPSSARESGLAVSRVIGEAIQNIEFLLLEKLPNSLAVFIEGMNVCSRIELLIRELTGWACWAPACAVACKSAGAVAKHEQ